MSFTEENDGVKISKKASRALLNKYLKEAVLLSHGKDKSKAQAVVHSYVRETTYGDDINIPSANLDKLREEDIVKARVELLKEEKPFGLKDKIVYATDADFIEDKKQAAVSAIMNTAVAGIFMWSAISNAESGNTSISVLSSYLSGHATYKAAKSFAGIAVAPKTAEGKERAQSYADLRHAKMALEMISKDFDKRKEDKMFMGVYTAAQTKAR